MRHGSQPHPMDTALFLFARGQALALPNWMAGPSYRVTFGILFAFRVRHEARMMLHGFEEQYSTDMAATKRLVPGVW